MDHFETATRESYDRVAKEYAHRFADELDGKPFDRVMLGWLARRVGKLGLICDLGCGPGQVARYLHGRGVQACGVDLSAEMIRQARRLNPGIPFEQGNMLALTDIADDTYAGIAAFYSIIHIPRPKVVEALIELRRVLKPQGILLLSYHIGQETRHINEWWEKPVSLDFNFFETADMKGYLSDAGFSVTEVIEREPYPPEIEVQTRRAYLFARNS